LIQMLMKSSHIKDKLKKATWIYDNISSNPK